MDIMAHIVHLSLVFHALWFLMLHIWDWTNYNILATGGVSVYTVVLSD